MRFRSKRYQKDAKKQPKDPVPLDEAIKQVKAFSKTKFDQSVDLVCHLGINPKQADQMIRGSVSLPKGIGASKRVIAFCGENDVEPAKEAGAVEAGGDELVQKIQDGWLDFDVAVAHPSMMGKVGKLGRVLGPQGKMPSPKAGTVTMDVAKAVKEYSAGKVEFKNDAGGNVHVVVGKQSFDAKKLIENIDAMIAYIKRIKPSGAKGAYIKKICLSATMSPGVLVAVE